MLGVSATAGVVKWAGLRAVSGARGPLWATIAITVATTICEYDAVWRWQAPAMLWSWPAGRTAAAA